MESATTEHVTTRNGVRLVYDRRGRGPFIVLVQGLGVPGEGWLTLPDTLAAQGFTVVTPDNRGTGRSSVPRSPYRMSPTDWSASPGEPVTPLPNNESARSSLDPPSRPPRG